MKSLSGFTDAESAACRHLVQLALQEDLGLTGDLTAQSVISADLQGRAVFVARAQGILAGMSAADLVAKAIEPGLTLQSLIADGTELQPGTALALITGPMRSILSAERIALNFLQHLSGVATLTRKYVDSIAGLTCTILDTRKTIPGWRLLDKYAVRCGGGHNHRMGLYDGILIKDNHLAAIGQTADAVVEAVKRARSHAGPLVPIEVEVESFEQLDLALTCAPEIILLDNMTVDELAEAVRQRNRVAPKVLLEASGGVNLHTLRAIAETGVDRISVGALSHSAPALDIALDYRL